MDFSKKYLLKYGWEEGQGLGKMKDGIKVAIKPRLKFDKAGMGFDPSTEFTNSWWMKVYNNALEDVNVKYEETVVDIGNKEEKHKEKIKLKKKPVKEESFTDLLNTFEGRTIHKGARQGLMLKGKLQRLEQQELQLLPKKEDTNIKEKSNIVKSSKSKGCVTYKITLEDIETSKRKKRKDNYNETIDNV